MKQFILIAIWVVAFINTGAQPYYFRHYQVEDGLSNNTTTCALQDINGFLWFGTKDGLNRFDGYSFRTFRHNMTDSNSIGNNSIWRLYQYKRDVIWVGTERGLYSYHLSSETFQLLPECPRTEIRGITSDREGNLWFIAGFKLYQYITAQKQLVAHRLPDYLDFCTAVTAGADGNIWIGSREGYIVKYQISRRQFLPFSIFEHSPPTTSGWIEKIYDSGSGFLLIGTSNQGVKKFNLTSNTYEDLLTHNPDHTEVYARCFLRYNAHEFWVGTENGIYIYDASKKTFTHLVKNPSNPYALSDNAIYDLVKDRQGGIWAGTYFGGINYYSRQKLYFEKFFFTPSENSIKGNAVREITEDKTGNIWIGTEDAGLNVYNKKNGSFTNYAPQDRHSNLSHTNIHALLADGDSLWIGTFEHGLDVMDINTRKIIRHYGYGQAPNELKSNFIHSAYKTRSGTILIGTSNGLFAYNRAKDHFNPLRFFPANTFFSCITEDNKGNIWVGTFKNGVYFYNPSLRIYGKIKIMRHNRDRLSENRITNLFIDHSQNLLISTEDGLYSVNTQTFQTRLYHTGNLLPSNLVYSTIEDSHHTLWISTSKGLVRLDKGNHRSRTFTTANGLLSNQFNYSSAFRDSEGLMYFGSVKGLVRFDPDNISAEKHNPPLYFTNLQINNKDVAIGSQGPLKASLLHTEKITLHHNQSSISLDFAALSFTAPRNIEYAYKLEGLDNEWNYIKTNRRVYFTNLSPGSYHFKVKCSDGDGYWYPNEKTLFIEILPPWWRTRWAYAVYALCVALGIYGIVIFYHQRHSEKQQRKMELFERIKEKEIYEAKIDFFTKIAHEIRTPLTLIKAPLEKLMRRPAPDRQQEKYLKVMNKNTDRLLNLTSQLLDFRRVEAGAFVLSLEKRNVNEIVKSILNNFIPLAENKSIRLDLSAEGNYYCKLDEEATTKIISNLVDNAIKYCHQTVNISIYSSESHFVNIQVANDGPLVPGEVRDKIFLPFFRSKKTNKITGAGIGLALSRSLAELQGGNLTMRVHNDKNIFVLILPLES